LYDSGKAVDITVYILLTCLELKDDPANHGLLRLLSYVLQTLSADQAFALCLNQTIRLNVPAKWAVSGTAADFMIVVSAPLYSFKMIIDAWIVNLLDRYYPRAKPIVPSSYYQYRQCLASFTQCRGPGFHPVDAAVQGVLRA
jgi:hypothetical protein